MQYDSSYGRSDKHDEADGEALTGVQASRPSVGLRFLIIRDVGQEPAQKLGLQEGKSILYELEKRGEEVDPAICGEECLPQVHFALALAKTTRY